MARIAQVFIAVTTALTLGGCAVASPQTKPFWTLHTADFNQLGPGMTMVEAENIVGKPLLATHFPRLAEQVWEYEFPDTQTRMRALVHFGAQEPGSNGEIARFCEVNYGVSFPMFAKSGVAGPAANPFFAMLAERTGKRPGWNFHKYLIDRRGDKKLSFESTASPDDPQLLREIERLLAAAG